MKPPSKKHCVQLYRKRTPILSQDTQYDTHGRPLNSEAIQQSMMQPEDRLREIISKKHAPYGPVGELEIAKSQLNIAKKEWKYHCDHSPTMTDEKKKTPTGHYAENINKASARKQVLEEESRALNAILREQEKEDDARLIKLQKKFKYHGLCKLKDGQIWKCDQRKVEYSDGLPFFKDDKNSVNEYLIEVKKRKKAKAIALAKIQREESQRIKNAEDEKLDQINKEVEKETKRILRRKVA